MTNCGDNPTSMVETPLHELDHTSTTLRRYRMVTMCSWTCITVFGCIVVVALVDNLIHLDQWYRFVALLIFVLGLGTTIVMCATSTRKRPDDVVALAIHLEHKRQSLRGWLAAAVELRHRDDHISKQCVQEASNRLRKSGPITVPTRGPMVSIGTMVLIIATLVVVCCIAPTTTSIALHRVLLPFGSTIWPARTSVESAMPINLVHGQGLPLRVQARNTTPNGATESVDVVLKITLNDGSTIQKHKELTHQTDDLHGGVVNLPPHTIGTMVWFETADASTTGQHIPIHPLPAIKSTLITVTPPWTHTSVIAPKTTSTEESFPHSYEPILSGSSIDLTIDFDPEVQTPGVSGDTETSWAQQNLGWTLPYPPDIKGTSSTWKLRWVMDADCTLKLHMEDLDGLQALNHPQLKLSNTIDTIPQIVLVEPDVDLALPPTAVITMHGRVVDDYPLHKIAIRVDAPLGDTTPFMESKNQPGNKATIQTTVALQSLGVKPGDILEIRVEAEDLGDTTTGHRVVQGKARIVQVVSLDRFLDDAHLALTTLGDAVRTMERRQTTLLNQSKSGDWTHTSESSQRRLARDIRTASQDASDVLDALDMGRVDALDLRVLADEAVLVLHETADLAMTVGSDQVGRDDSQQVIQTALTALADRLSGDHDQWAAQRMVRDLLERQRVLQSVLAGLDGKSSKQDKQRDTTLDNAQTAQKTLADDTYKTATTLQGTPQDAISKALLEENVEASMRSAVNEASNNRIGLARAAQAQASSALERINNQLTQSKNEQRTQVATLRRRLSDLQSLVFRLLENQRTALVDFKDTSVGDHMAQQLQRIHRGILSAVQRAARAGNSTHGIESTLREASAIQSSAILSLVQSPIDVSSAHGDALFVESHLMHTLDLIEDASGDLARHENQQQTTQLAQIIKSIATQQLTVRTSTEAHLEKIESNRRQRFELRQLGTQQTMVVDAIESLSASDATIESSMMARAALRAAAKQAREAASPLLDGSLRSIVVMDQKQVEIKLNRLADAITASGMGSNTNTSPFNHSHGGGGSGTGSPGKSQQSSGLPSVAELRILRGLQADLLQRTQVAVDESDVATFELIAQDQRELAELSTALMDEVSTDHHPIVKEVDESNSDIEQSPTIPLQIQPIPISKNKTDIPTPLPSLNALLGLEDTGPTQSMPEVPSDALEAVSIRLTQAADALQDDAIILAQRLQRDALARIDALLQQANKQNRTNQSQSTSGDPMEQARQATDTGASQGQPTNGNTDSKSSGEIGDRDPNTQDPQLGGNMEHRGAAWGTLPPRLRAMLEQGRRDDTSLLYADICAEYFRILLESPNP